MQKSVLTRQCPAMCLRFRPGGLTHHLPGAVRPRFACIESLKRPERPTQTCGETRCHALDRRNGQKKLRGTKSRRKSVELVTPEGSSPRSRQPASKKSNIGRIASALACKGASIMRIISTMRTNCATLLAAQHGSDLHRQLDRIGQMLSVHCEVQIEAFANGRDLSRVLMRLPQNLRVILQPTLCAQRRARCSC